MGKNKQTPRTIALDFDGVLHKYNGWQNGKIDGPIPGAKEAVERLLAKGYEVVVFSTRDFADIMDWLVRHDFPKPPGRLCLEVTNIKKPFYVIVDDRAVQFDGVWDNGMLSQIVEFEPYWIKARPRGEKPPSGLCAACSEGPLVREIRPIYYYHQGQAVIVDQPGDWCQHCGEGNLNGEDIAAAEAAFERLKAK